MSHNDLRRPGDSLERGIPKESQKPHDAQDLRQCFLGIRQATEKLANTLSEEDCALQSMPDASPVKWHLAHTTWFFETFLLECFSRDFKPFDPTFRVLFNSYYNGVGAKHPRSERGLISRPTRKDILAYRQHVTSQIVDLINCGVDKEVEALLWLGCNHEEQHQELILTDLKHLLSKNPLKPAYASRWPLTRIEARNPRWIAYAGGLVETGHGGVGFGFDNESPRHREFLEPFELFSHPVTHGDVAAFVMDGGYMRPELWLSMGWDWVQANGVKSPMYWELENGNWRTFTLHGMIDIDPNTPICHVNYFEADAFARWAGSQKRWANARLPREGEWEHAATRLREDGNFVESGALHPLAFREDPDLDQPAQMFGDVWEWTQSAYLPFPGFKIAPGAVGEYNGKFMCNQLVLRGGSCATPRRHIRASYRNFFPPDARWQFSGLRLARDAG